MSKLSEAMRDARKFRKTVQGWDLEFLTPKVGELHHLMQRAKASDLDPVMMEIELCLEFVLGWRGVTQAKLLPSGSDQDAPFDRDVWREILIGEPKLWREVSEVIYDAHEAAKKKSASVEAS